MNNFLSKSSKEKDFLDVYEQYADAIYRHCYFRVYNKELAEDLTQETFIKTWTYLSEGKEIKNIKAFLYRVAINLVIDNSRKKTALSLDEFKEKEVSIRQYNIVEEKVFSQAEFASIFKTMDKLEDKYKDIILMRYMQDFSPAEIADVLGVSANVVSARLNYAVKKLKKIIKII